MRLKLLLDQNVRADTLPFLRGLGLDATSTRELGMERATDDEISAWASENGHIVVTFNEDFADIRSFAFGENPGVIRLRIEPQTTEVVHPVLEALLRDIPHQQFMGALTIVSPTKVRIRRGP